MLKARFSSKSTEELKLRRYQITELLWTSPVSAQNGGQAVNVNVGSSGIDSDRAEELFEEKSAIERELLRRWKAGDESAWLEVFGDD